jgi:flavin-dependent thymidylate synthase
MRVTLAGFNVDSAVIDEAAQRGVDRDVLTPEPISAAYARISRYRKPVGELRRGARTEVAKARRSNHKIIWEMGHHSVAEHAVFNFDLVGLSRLAIEAIEHFRLCSYTEKSQRYITLDGDFVVPAEVKDVGLVEEFTELVGIQNDLYGEIYDTLLDRLVQASPERAETRPGKRLLEGEAKEDARYVTCLATEGQLGMTVNARNLELVVRRLAAHPLAEVRELGQELHGAVSKVAPSLILFTQACDFDRLTYDDLAGVRTARADTSTPVPGSSARRALKNGAIRMVASDVDADRRLVAALLHTTTHRSYGDCYDDAQGMSQASRRKLVMASMARMELFDAVLREFEHVGCSFELEVSAACFGQLKRHRMMTLTCQPYLPTLGITVPPAVIEAGLSEKVEEVARRSEALHDQLLDVAPAAAPYALMNAHRRRVLVTLSARELYHVSRLREDQHAQWDIQQIAAEMVRQAADVMPLTLVMACGKDAFPGRYEDLFGHPPRIVESSLPC